MKVLRLEVSIWISETIWKGVRVFYQVFLLSPLQCKVTELRNCKRLREFEEIEVNVNSKEENSLTFVWISSKNLASGGG